MLLDKILSRIRKEKELFDKDVEIAPGYSFNQRKTIQRIENYMFSRFESGPLDEDGWTKPFYNIVRKPCAVAAKEIDLDTKDIIIRPENGDYDTAEIMSAEFKQWMKDEGFAADLNEYADLCPEYGSVVVKKVGERLHTVDLKGFIISNVQAKSLDDTNIIETHCYSREDFQKEATKRGWDKEATKKVLEAHDKAGRTDIEVDERYGWIPESELKAGGSEETMVYTLCIAGASSLVEEIAQKDKEESIIQEKGAVLFHEVVKEHPYREWHWMKMPNRWLGVGFVETLFDAQVRANENAYYKAKALGWIGVHVFYSDDDTITKNLLNDVKNGDIIRLGRQGAVLQEVQTQERNLAYYASEENRWDKNTADMTFTPEIITGEGLPSGTPARSAMISDQNVKRYYDRKREDFGIWIKSIIEDDVLPLFEKQRSAAHTFTFSGAGPDRDTLERRIFNTRMVGIFQDFITRKGYLPSSEEWRRIMLTERQKLSRAATLDVKIPDGAYKNLKKRLDVIITKENEDTDSKLAGRQAVLKILAENPNIATSPATRPIFLELANLLGVKTLNLPTEAEVMSSPTAPQMAQPGATGEIAAPTLPAAVPA